MATKPKSSKSLRLADLTSTPSLTPLVIPELDGGVVYLRPLLAGMVMDMLGESDKPVVGTAMLKLVANTLANEDGSLMCPDQESVEELKKVRADVFNRIAAAITESIASKTAEAAGADAGKDGGLGDGSSTDSLPS